ncbi:MAG: hypothetical protein LUP97_08690 [Methanoregula sp.]|nr:hypothetical protein [Methanoregula sp.]
MHEGTDQDRWKQPVIVLIAIAILGIIIAIAYSGIFMPVGTGHPSPGVPPVSVLIQASPQTYSPLISSTPGIGLLANLTGSDGTGALFLWNASYGEFLEWNPPGYIVGEKGSSAVTHGETIYWSFAEFPGAVKEPVVITVDARDPNTGRSLGNSRLILGWEQNNTFVRVQEIQ